MDEQRWRVAGAAAVYAQRWWQRVQMAAKASIDGSNPKRQPNTPLTLDGVARVQQAPLGTAQVGLAGGSIDALKHEVPARRIHVAQHARNAVLARGRVKCLRLLARHVLRKFKDEREQNHGKIERRERACARQRRLAQRSAPPARRCIPRDDAVEQREGLGTPRHIARGARDLGEREHRKRRTEGLALRQRGRAFARECKREVPRGGVDGVRAQELRAAHSRGDERGARERDGGRGAPRRAGRDGGGVSCDKSRKLGLRKRRRELGKHPHLPPLEPHVLRCVKHSAIRIEAVEKAAVGCVNRMRSPKREHAAPEIRAELANPRGEQLALRGGEGRRH